LGFLVGVELVAGYFAGVSYYGVVAQGACIFGDKGVGAEVSGGPPTWGQYRGAS